MFNVLANLFGIFLQFVAIALIICIVLLTILGVSCHLKLRWAIHTTDEYMQAHYPNQAVSLTSSSLYFVEEKAFVEYSVEGICTVKFELYTGKRPPTISRVTCDAFN